MPTYDELEVSVGMMIEGTKWTGPVLRANFGGGYGAAAIVDSAAGLHLWTLKQAQLPGDSSLVPISAQSRFDYYWDFYVAHTTGTTEIFIIEWRGKKYHASFVDPSMDVQRAAFKIGMPDWSTGGGWKIRQRRVAGFSYNADGSIDSNPPSVPVLVSVTPIDPNSLQAAWLASTDPPGEIYTLAGYQIRIDATTVIDVGNVLTYTYGFFGPGTTHQFEVRSYDGGGNLSDWSNALSGTTSATPPAPLLIDSDSAFLIDSGGAALIDG